MVLFGGSTKTNFIGINYLQNHSSWILMARSPSSFWGVLFEFRTNVESSSVALGSCVLEWMVSPSLEFEPSFESLMGLASAFESTLVFGLASGPSLRFKPSTLVFKVGSRPSSRESIRSGGRMPGGTEPAAPRAARRRCRESNA